MKHIKKISILITLLIILISNSLSVSANLIYASNGEKNPKLETNIEPLSQKKFIIDVLKKALKNFLTGRTLSDYPGAVIDNGDSFLVQHPNIRFNHGGNPHRVRKDLRVYGQDEVRAFMNNNSIFPTGTKPIIEIYSGERDPVAGGPVRSGQNVTYKFPGGRNTAYDKYYIVYGTSESEDWIPRLWYIRSSEPCIPCLPLSEGNDFTFGNIENNKESNRYKIIGEKTYIRQANINSYISSKDINSSLKMDDIYFEFYDAENKELTNQAKTLKHGDVVNVVDQIINIEYNKETDYTTFMFNSTHAVQEYHNISFSGDLTPVYKIGDHLKLNFEVIKVAEIDKEIFIEFDYNIIVQDTETVPRIDSFIKK